MSRSRGRRRLPGTLKVLRWTRKMTTAGPLTGKGGAALRSRRSPPGPQLETAKTQRGQSGGQRLPAAQSCAVRCSGVPCPMMIVQGAAACMPCRRHAVGGPGQPPRGGEAARPTQAPHEPLLLPQHRRREQQLCHNALVYRNNAPRTAEAAVAAAAVGPACQG